MAGPARRPARAVARDLERLQSRVTLTQQALELERERRAELDRKLDEERAAGRRLRAELARVRAELELTAAARAEADAASAELETARRELEMAQRRQRPGSGRDLPRGPIEAERERGRDLPRAPIEAERERGRDHPRAPIPAERGRDRDRDRERSAGRSARPPGAHAAGPVLGRPLDREAHPRPAPVTRPRPLNPSLRHRTYWLGRLLALIVIAAVIAAIVLVVRSTIS